MKKGIFAALAAGVSIVVAACSKDAPTSSSTPSTSTTACSGVAVDPSPPSTTPATMRVLGAGLDTIRYTAEIAVHGSIAYTTTWNVRRVQGNKVNIWDVSANCPVLIDSLIVPNVVTTGDVQISDDGKLLVVATELSPGSIMVYDLSDPRKPQLLSRFANDQTLAGVHTAKLGRVNGKLYGFLCVDPASGFPARLVIVDLSNPAAPQQVYEKITGNPYVHDTYPRDGLLFVGLWNNGMDIWDIGGGAAGGSPQNPVVLGNVRTVGGEVHNIWWYHDAGGSKRFAFVGEEGPGSIGTSSRGDIHVIDVSDLTQPKEVAFYHEPDAGGTTFGTHNFSVDEANGVLYAAYYNGGVRALDVRGDLSTCTPAQQNLNVSANIVRCDLRLMGRELATGLTELNRQVYVWGVSYVNGSVFASDMVNGIWRLGAVK